MRIEAVDLRHEAFDWSLAEELVEEVIEVVGVGSCFGDEPALRSEHFEKIDDGLDGLLAVIDQLANVKASFTSWKYCSCN